MQTIKAMIILKYNCKGTTCTQYHDYLTHNKTLLKKISANEKYQ